MVPDLLINDYRSKPRNFLVFISLCVLLFCILLRMFLTKKSSSSTETTRTETIRETSIVTEKIIEPPKIQELQPVLNSVENIEKTITSSSSDDNINWALILFALFCILLLLACFYLLYLLFKSKHKSITPEVADGDPLVVLIKDPVPAKPVAPVVAPAAPTQASENVATNKYQNTKIRVMDTPVNRNYGDLEIKYEPDPVTLNYPDETIYDIRNAPQQTYTPDQQYVYEQPQQQYYVEDRPMPFDYVSQEEPRRRNVAFYDTYNAYEQRSCAIPPIDYDEIGCSNTRHGDHCQCETCT